LPAKRDETAERPIPGSQAMSARLLPTAVRLAGKSALRAQSDARLTELTREGSGPAFEVIVARYRRPLLRHCAGVLGEADAEDAVQEAFAKAHAAFSRGEQVRKLGPWLYAVAHNVAVSVLRSRAARPECSEPECPEAQLVDETAEQREQLRAVLAAVESLPRRQRDAIVLQAIEGRSYDEIAGTLGASPGAVAQLLNRARISVRERVLALTPVEPLTRWVAGLTNTSAATRVVALSGGCALTAKLCTAALFPAAVAVVPPITIPNEAAPAAVGGARTRGPSAAGATRSPTIAASGRDSATIRVASVATLPGRGTKGATLPPSPHERRSVGDPRSRSNGVPGTNRPPLGERPGGAPHGPAPAAAPGPHPDANAQRGAAAAWAPESRTGSDFNWLMKGDSTVAVGPASSIAGNRASVSSNSTRSSNRANAVPRQK
jgi:RNA polymerase sigma-70 factor (ECF subfamily)